MQKSSLLLVGGSILGVFLLVYGSAVVNYLLTGNYFMKGGLLDPNYLILALLCALPFILGSLIRMSGNPKKHINMIIMSGLLFAVHFVFVHWLFVYSEIELSVGILARSFIVFPISAMLVVGATRIGLTMKIASDEI